MAVVRFGHGIGRFMASEQKTLFDTGASPWEVDAATEVLVASVVLPSGPPSHLSYVVPDAMRTEVVVGGRVRVPLGRGNRLVTGYCVALENQTGMTRRLKAIRAIVDRRSLLSPAMLRLTRWMAEYYLCPLGQVLDTVIPAGVRGAAGTRLTTLLSLSQEAERAGSELRLPKKQSQVVEYLASQKSPDT